IDIACIVMAALPAACLLDLQPLARWLQSLAMVARVAAALASLWLVFDDARRRIPMGWPLATVAVLTVAASVPRQLIIPGSRAPLTWLRPGDTPLFHASLA